ncbi:MAG: hypothetical protein AAGC60_18105 [Acidobacteriota bacterium]
MSQITIINQTEDHETVRIAVYKKPVVRPTLQTIAWQIVNPPPDGQCVVPVPADYTVFAEYSDDPNNPQDPQYTTNTIAFSELTARFDINSVTSQDRQASGAFIEQKFDDLVMNEVRVTNNYGMGVWGHIQKDGTDVYPAQVIWPGGVLLEDLRSFLYLAVVGQFTYRGDDLVQEEISLTETPILEGGTATVTGSMWKGYTITT